MDQTYLFNILVLKFSKVCSFKSMNGLLHGSVVSGVECGSQRILFGERSGTNVLKHTPIWTVVSTKTDSNERNPNL